MIKDTELGFLESISLRKLLSECHKKKPTTDETREVWKSANAGMPRSNIRNPRAKATRSGK